MLDSTAQNYCLEKEKRPHLWMPLKENESLDKTAAFVDPSCPDVSCRIALALPQAYRGAVSKVRIVYWTYFVGHTRMFIYDC